MIIKGDKVIQIKEMGKINSVGNMFEVANFVDTNIVLRDAKTKIAICSIDVDEFNRYFKKADGISGWTGWAQIVDPHGNMVAQYRTNQKKVEVRIPNNMLGYPDKKVIRSTATCSHGDDFNLSFGIQLAYLRCEQKYLQNEIDEYNELISDAMKQKKECTAQIVENKSIIKKMLSSLYEQE